MQDDSGLKRFLTHPKIYDLFQNMLGAKKVKKWMAKNYWKLKGGEKVVDIGCGPGEVLDYIPENIIYVGLDISEKYIEHAKQKYGNRAKFILGSTSELLKDMPIEIMNADLIICNGILHHLNDEDAMEVLSFAKQAMNPKGRVVCYEPVYLAHQSFMSRWIISKDRGQGIREERQWKEMTSRVFSNFTTSVITGLLRIPYDYIIIEGFSEDRNSI